MIKKAVGPALALSTLLSLGGCTQASARSETEGALQGVVEFEQKVLAFEVGGRVETLHVTEGQRVEAGAPLATLDDELSRRSIEARAADARSARAELERIKSGSRREDVGAMAARVQAAKATEELLEKTVARQRALFEKNVVSRASLDDVEGQLARATAERRSLEQNLLALRRGARSEEIDVAEARALAVEASVAVEQARLERHRLFAPSAGEVLDVHVEAGEIVGAGSAVITLAETAQPYVDVFVPQGKLAGIAVGREMLVRVDAYQQRFRGRVEHVAQKTEFTPRFLFSERERPNLVVRVRVRVDDKEQKLHAGVPAFVSPAGAKP